MFRTILIVALVLGLMPLPIAAGEIGGVMLPETLKAGDETLILNGAGLRKKLFVKVYAGGLYLKEKNQDAAAVIAADQPMAIRMHFIYDGVSSEKLIDAWNEGFDNSLGDGRSALKAEIDQFNGYFTVEAKENDIYDLVYLPGKGVAVSIKGEVAGVIPGLPFKQALFAIWLGDEPADDDLKEGMIGSD